MGLTADGCSGAWSRIFCALTQDEGSESGGKDEGHSGELHVDIEVPKECMSCVERVLGSGWWYQCAASREQGSSLSL